jgi:hypothetical protein
MLNSFHQYSLFMNNCVNSLFPGSEFLTNFTCGHSTKVIAEKFVSFIFTSLNLGGDEGSLGVICFLAALDFLVALGDFGDNEVLVVDQLVLVAEVRIDDPSLQCTALHEVFYFAEDTLPVFLGGLLSIGFEADGVVGNSHALVLQICVLKGCSTHISVVLKRLLIESEIPSKRII